ncbi:MULTISPECIES: nickel-responsive transcriptional regulator NikR [Zoogloea]|jgi:CopG family nickel-responsive transcriptional regulator|uniref:Putative nickel-responsive regulator n=1 Tax=Zoogloea oryzae TaxID=310767 RepID=A0ABQ6FEL7_9RHOO|nr:nickel-responsive transcriptional regulator NikR [Zoogloea oryzae]GLT23067.1 nickel-responsive regulator [Zoogloea oryzae]
MTRLSCPEPIVERFTISLDEDLARAFDALIAARGYSNRSEAVRDILRAQLEQNRLAREEAPHCIANLSYVYNHHERELAERVTHDQHEHHDLCVATLHAHLDHDNCMESVILRGPTAQVRAFAEGLIARPGVRHGALNLVTADFRNQPHSHGDGEHSHAHPHPHGHYRPRS